MYDNTCLLILNFIDKFKHLRNINTAHMEKVKLPNEISLKYPKWFFKALHYLHHGEDLTLENHSKSTEVNSTGRVLFELIRWEADALQRKVKGLPDFLKFPYHGKDFSLDWFEKSLKPLFLESFFAKQGGVLTDDEQFNLQLLFNELTQNALDHSGSEKFLVLIEPFGIGVFDLGVSIPSKLEQIYQFKNDQEAVEAALKEGITTRRLRPGGFGLYYTLDQVKQSEGYLYIASRSAQIRRYLKSKKIERKILNPPMRGTLIYCGINNKQKDGI